MKKENIYKKRIVSLCFKEMLSKILTFPAKLPIKGTPIPSLN